MKKIQLTQGKYALVDDEDFKWLNKQKWCITSAGYAVFGKRINGKNTLFLMHREIMKVQKGKEIDHINGDTLDNRKKNLRICSHLQNHQNRGKQINNTSGYRGVYLDKRDGVWYFQITLRRKMIATGRFKTSLEAALAYDKAAKRYYGKFVRFNFPPSSNSCL